MAEKIANVQDIYSLDYFEKGKDTKVGYTSYLSSPAADLLGKYAFARLLSGQKSPHLDIGCADGSLMEIFVSEGVDSYGLDISQGAVNRAQSKGLKASQSDLDPLPDNLPAIQVITAFDLLEHLSKPKKTLDSIIDTLDEDGCFIFSTLCVDTNGPNEYWYNNSLEHFIYFNETNLTNLLADTFGSGNFGFIKYKIGEVTEFWGFAKKGDATVEKTRLEQIRKKNFTYDKDSEAAYFACLFYARMSRFEESARLITHFASLWAKGTLAQAQFYQLYFQGRLELAIQGVEDSKDVIPASNSIFWQAYGNALTRLFQLQKKSLIQESNEEIIGLREQVFKLKDEIYRIRGYKVIGRLIRFRESVRPALREGRQTLSRLYRRIRWIVARPIPVRYRRAVMRVVRFDYQSKLVKTKTVSSKPWDKSAPLVSIVIPYFNRADTIQDTIDSLSAQTFTNFEIIIVDDGSTDEASRQKLTDLVEDGLRAKVIYQKNQGVAAARNAGVGKAQGKYIVCLDSDDMLDPTYIEKGVAVLETSPDVSLFTTYRDDFGVLPDRCIYSPYDPIDLYINNMVVTAAMFKKEAWRSAGGYKSGIGYEDWEFWLNLGERGYWGRVLPEPLFLYRTSMQSRFVEDKDVHWSHIKKIRGLHARYKKRVNRLMAKRQYVQHVIDPRATAFVNMDSPGMYEAGDKRPKILITVPWMTFGGAETLIYNYCREIRDRFNITFVTGLKSDHEWEYKFKEITPRVYHLANMFDDKALHLEFIANYVQTRNIDILHIIHNGFTFEMLPELKRRFPSLKVVVTMFNDRVEYFEQSLGYSSFVDEFISDNEAVAKHYRKKLPEGHKVDVIPNGINCYNEFNPELFDRAQERASLDLGSQDLVVLFVGRLSEEKNPDVYLQSAREIVSLKDTVNIKFLVVGDGPMRSEVEKTIAEIDSQNILYLGYKSDVARYMSVADIFVLPSSIEGFPLSILEAMAMNLAIIASRVGAVPDVVKSGEEGFVVTPGSASEIKEAILALHRDPALLKSFKENSRRRTEKMYSNTVLGNNYLEMYEGVLE